MKQSKSRKTTVLNSLGTFGYLACLVQWLWTMMILLPTMLDSQFFKFLTPSGVKPQVTPVAEAVVSTGTLPPFISIIALVIGALLVLGMVYIVIVKFPKSVAKTGEKVTHTVAEVISPIVIQHTHLPVKQQRQLPELVIISVKLLLVFTPLSLLLFAQGEKIAMSFEIIMIIGTVLFSWSFLLFTLQYVLSKLLKASYKTLR